MKASQDIQKRELDQAVELQGSLSISLLRRTGLYSRSDRRLMVANDRVIEEMKSLGALSKPLTLAIDWHNVMYYGDPRAQGVVGTQPKKGSHYSYRFATNHILLVKKLREDEENIKKAISIVEKLANSFLEPNLSELTTLCV